ncbi:GGDEF domain-containing sensory box protein [Legionella gratiana]|uniref:GGDEF domain-containing sensory box protein n=1 Tax=Legionella gratiana TaxID=45066 RepID=A0A378JDD7_9GAMM|nr:EAL domain-containing protein [Legionella gratiana]KTD06545.1 GGDEF domain-containing sensory box protein [Legionella gratiana]STX45366.1 sensory box protein, GGDEF family protein, LssE [Legionella gratiana]
MAVNKNDPIRVLIIDDMPEIHQSLLKILSKKQAENDELSKLEKELFESPEPKKEMGEALVSFQIFSAMQGQEGLEKIKEGIARGKPYALAFIDVRMPPGWDGIETIKRVWEVDPTIQIVICTAYSDYSWEQIIAEFGEKDNLLILKKPFDAIAIRQIASALSKKWQLTHETRENMSLLERRISERTQSLQASLSVTRGTLESSADAILVFSHDYNIIDYNQNLIKFWKLPSELLEQKKVEPILEFISKQLQEEEHFMNFVRITKDKIKKTHKTINLTTRTHQVFELIQQEYKMGEHDIGHIFSFRDITSRALMEAKIRYQATHDPLTKLANRILLYDRIEYAISQAKREGTFFAVLYFDLNHFKLINDSLGHNAGDALLIDIAKRLQSRLRKTDTIARIGGDEFVMVVTLLKTMEHIKQFVKAILKQFDAPFIIQGHEVFMSTSVGVALYPEDGNNPEELLANADIAMYTAKEIGGNRSNFYNRKLKIRQKNWELQFDFHKALKNKEFFLTYQPQFQLNTKKLHAIEALVRWNHPKKGLLLPTDFIEAAEETGFIIPLGNWILKEACVQNKKWQDMGLSKIAVAVNMGTKQLRQPELPKMVKRILDETGLEAKYLEIELTENALINLVQNKHIMELKKLGVKLTLDDFGSGYSSLNYLRRFEVDRLKIDKSFIDKINIDHRDEQIIQAIISMGEALGFQVVAEGVETESQILFLQSKNCEDVQGFYFSKPLMHHEIETLLAKKTPRK